MSICDHSVVVAGGFRADGSFEPCPVIHRDTVEKVFQAKVFALLLEKGLIGPELVTKMKSWRHSGFNIYLGPAIQKIEDGVRVGLYIVRAPAASGRLTVGDGPTLKYLAKSFVGGQDQGRLFESPGEVYDVLEWIARLTSHIPDQGAQLIHYYAAYSNAHRGKRRRQAASEGSGTEGVAVALSPVEDESDWVRQRRRSWAALVQLVYEVNPLLCRCGGTMRMMAIISASEQPEVVDRILKCVGYRFEVLELPARPPPPPEPEPSESTSDCSFM
ncbi:MAG: transposase [Acidobacteria bacterium]|nr:transposase [Acidobacteriota bacterium]